MALTKIIELPLLIALIYAAGNLVIFLFGLHQKRQHEYLKLHGIMVSAEVVKVRKARQDGTQRLRVKFRDNNGYDHEIEQILPIAASPMGLSHRLDLYYDPHNPRQVIRASDTSQKARIMMFFGGFGATVMPFILYTVLSYALPNIALH